jgi:hypothetical protein
VCVRARVKTSHLRERENTEAADRLPTCFILLSALLFSCGKRNRGDARAPLPAPLTCRPLALCSAHAHTPCARTPRTLRRVLSLTLRLEHRAACAAPLIRVIKKSLIKSANRARNPVDKSLWKPRGQTVTGFLFLPLLQLLLLRGYCHGS